MSCVLVLLMAIDVVVVVVGLVLTCCFLGVPLPLLLYSRERGYKEGNILHISLQI
jgi:hypothetical protein